MKLSLLILSVFVLFFACEKGEKLAARVGDRKIYAREVEEMVQRYIALSRRVDQSYKAPGGDTLADMRRNFLEGLIDKIVVLDRAAQRGVTVSDDELNLKIQQLRRGNQVVEDSLFDHFLSEQGLTAEQFRKNIRELMVMEKMRDSLLSGIEISEAEMKAYYEANTAHYAREKMRAAHLLLRAPGRDLPEHNIISVESRLKAENPSLSGEALAGAVRAFDEKVRRLADSLAARARAGDDFTMLAKKFSEDPSGKFGGDLGEFSRGDMMAAFDSAAFALKKGEVAGPVKTVFGYHVIKAMSDPQVEKRDYKEVMNDINGLLLVKKRRERLASLREGVKIERLWDGRN